MKPTTPIILLLLILWLIAFQILPRVLALTIALTGELVMFLFRCTYEVYGQRPMKLRPLTS